MTNRSPFRLGTGQYAAIRNNRSTQAIFSQIDWSPLDLTILPSRDPSLIKDMGPPDSFSDAP